MLFRPLFTMPTFEADKGVGGGAPPAVGPGDGGTPAGDPAPTETPEGDPPGGDDDAFDKERAMDTIRKLRAEAKANKDAAKRLADLEAAETKRKQAEMSELDKFKAQVAEKDAAMQKLQDELATSRKRQEFSLAARRLELKFASAEAEADAFSLADLSEVEIGEDGKVVGMDDALKSLKKSKAYLFGQAAQAPEIDAQSRGGPKPGELDDARKSELAQRFRLRLPK